jgi:hypothetical protein
MSSRTSAAEGEQLKEYIRSFLNALKPIIVAATGSATEIELARMYLMSQSATKVCKTYHKQMDMILEGKPVWYWIANKNEKLLVQHPELLLGFEHERIKTTTQLWLSLLTPEQKHTVWQWQHGLLQVAGFDVGEALEQHAVESQDM